MNSIEIQKFADLSYAGQEALNTLCSNLSFAGDNVRCIMVTSSHASEGKSFMSMNIMRTLAKNNAEKTVVLVDADLRRSYIASQYKLSFDDDSEKMGLAHFLAGKAEIENVVYSTNIPGAYMVPIGTEVKNPLPLLNSARFQQMIAILKENFDYVLIDAPPVGVVIDAAEIAKNCDGTLIVVNYNSVRRQELIDVKRQMEQTGCPIIGTVLNKVDYRDYLGKKYYYKSNYGYYYSNDHGSSKSKHGHHRDLD